jgi:hypothetical protein
MGTPALGADEVLRVPPDAIAKLEKLRAEPKFQAEAGGMYTGVHDAAQRERAQRVINGLIRSIEDELPEKLTKQFVLAEFTIALHALDLSDTEDRERACVYLESIMDCVGLDSSDGLLNTWLYSFDPNSMHFAPS